MKIYTDLPLPDYLTALLPAAPLSERPDNGVFLCFGEHGLQFIAYCASLHNIDEQLKFMFGEKDDKIDLLLKHMSTAKRSAYYYAPSVERLADL